MPAHIQLTKKKPVLASSSQNQRTGPVITGAVLVSFDEGVVMRQDNVRLTRLLRECDVSAGPFVLLAAACAVLVLKLMLMP